MTLESVRPHSMRQHKLFNKYRVFRRVQNIVMLRCSLFLDQSLFSFLICTDFYIRINASILNRTDNQHEDLIILYYNFIFNFIFAILKRFVELQI